MRLTREQALKVSEELNKRPDVNTMYLDQPLGSYQAIDLQVYGPEDRSPRMTITPPGTIFVHP